jgi:hypothetical protein
MVPNLGNNLIRGGRQSVALLAFLAISLLHYLLGLPNAAIFCRRNFNFLRCTQSPKDCRLVTSKLSPGNMADTALRLCSEALPHAGQYLYDLVRPQSPKELMVGDTWRMHWVVLTYCMGQASKHELAIFLRLGILWALKRRCSNNPLLWDLV